MFNTIFHCFIQIPERADCELSSFKSDTNKITNEITQYGSEKIKCLSFFILRYVYKFVVCTRTHPVAVAVTMMFYIIRFNRINNCDWLAEYRGAARALGMIKFE